MGDIARPAEQYHEDFGSVLWWRFPINEPPYVGTPNDDNWPGYHTHWTRIEAPQPPDLWVAFNMDNEPIAVARTYQEVRDLGREWCRVNKGAPHYLRRMIEAPDGQDEEDD